MMVSRILNSDCNESRLKSFLNDRLPEAETNRLADHLDQCEACRRTLERLAAGDQICRELHEAASAFGPAATARARPADTPGLGSHSRDLPHIDDLIALDFLEPATKPGSLGRLGPYDVTELLGRGGFGIVLKAFDGALNRFVAIKVLAAQLAVSAAARNRFAREARAAAAVVHENVVAIHAVDAWKGLPYLVMPCIDGRSLQERVDRDGPLAVKEVLRIGMQAALGLAAAHDQGLVHRDVKPSNILLENGVERVRLSDFGLARAIDDASQTQSGVIAGTPQYMSPEQARGEPVDHRSDLFSLGSVMYFMCAGHPPFRANSTPAVLRRVCDDRPRSLRDVNPDVPPWLAALIDRLLAKEAGARYSSAAEVAEALKHHLAELQRTGTSAPLGGPVAVRVQRSGKRMSVSAMVAASVALGALGVAAASGMPGAFLTLVAGTNDNGKATARSDRAINGGPPAVLAAALRDGDKIVGSGVRATKEWKVADFTAVEIGSSFQAEITRGDAFKVTTSSDDNMIPFIKVVTKGKTLSVGLEPGHSFQVKEPLKAQVVLPRLEGLDVSGASVVAVKGFRSENEFKLRASGASKVDAAIELANADFDISGASQLNATGSGETVRFTISGASQVKLEKFPVKQAVGELSGASHAWLTVRSGKGLKAGLSGASRLEGSIDAANVGLKLDGASVAKLRGKANSATLAATGASHLSLKDFALDEAAITLAGGSQATVNAAKSLKYVLSSGSTLEYTGEPASVVGTKAGGGTIRHRP